MTDRCCDDACAAERPPVDPRVRRALWIALVVNVIMFGVEMGRPDFAVAAVMAVLALSAAAQVLARACCELDAFGFGASG